MTCAPRSETLHDLHTHDPLVPMYEVDGESPEEESVAAVRALEEISDRLRRLHAAYGEWAEFDAGAYFDLGLAQTRRLVHVSERVSRVHVTFFGDLLLPSFRRAEHYWYYGFCPAYRQMLHGLRTATEPSDLVNAFTQQAQPQMIRLWNRLLEVVNKARAVIQQESAFLLAYLCEEERARWQHAWRQEPAGALALELRHDLRSLPTLTLSTEFPLPPSRQPGRLRRLRINRARGRPPRFLRWGTLDG